MSTVGLNGNTKNVRLGVCQVIYDGVDLGLTQGGVEATVKTDTHKVNVDQYGKSSVNEYIMGRDVSVKVPLAETTIENLVAIMPGATMTYVGGTVANGTITVASQPTAAQNIVINGVVINFVSAIIAGSSANQVLIGATPAATAANLQAFLAASNIPALALATYTILGSVITVTYGAALLYGSAGGALVIGNSFTLSAGTAGVAVTLSGATLTGGADPTAKSVCVTNAINTSLLAGACELRLRPVYNQASQNPSEDFVVFLAATAGALQFAYKLENERVYNVEFNGYPDTNNNGRLFGVGVTY